MGERVQIEKIRKALEHNQKLVNEGYKANGQIITEEEWNFYDLTLRNFGLTFQGCLPENHNPSLLNYELLKEYIET
ncbi:MAG: hypothetical protein Q8O46_02820, partial [bacterium]|nr:hypothetical protein [bacterium]